MRLESGIGVPPSSLAQMSVAAAPPSYFSSVFTWLLLALAFTSQILAQEIVSPAGVRDARGARSYALGLVVPLAAFCLGLFRSAQSGALPTKTAPLRAHVFVGLLLYGSFHLSALSVPHLPTPVFLASKSVKSLFTMVIAALWLRKRFSGMDWGAAALSACGLALCLGLGSGGGGGVGGGSGGGRAGGGSYGDGASPWLGALLLVASMGCDGGAANAQDAMMCQFGTPSTELTLLAYGTAALAGLVQGLATGDLSAAAALLRGNGRVAAALAVYGAASMAATGCTLSLIGAFGASSFTFMSTAAKGLQLCTLLLGRGDAASLEQRAGFAVMAVAAAMAFRARAEAERAAVEGAIGAAPGAQPPAAAAPSTPPASPTPSPRTAGGGAQLRRRGGSAERNPAANPSSPVPPAPLSLQSRARSGADATPASPASPLARLRSEASGVLTAATALALGIERPAPAVETLAPIATVTSGSPKSLAGREDSRR